MGDFATLNTALTGLLAHRRALDVIGHNVANANTPGFVRRRAELNAISSTTLPGVFAGTDRMGGGVLVEGITRIRDEFLEVRSLRETGIAGRISTEATMLSQIEDAIPEPSDVGLAAQLAEFWSSWDDAANSPSNIPVRTALLERATTLIDSMQRVAGQFSDLRENAVVQVTATVAQVNATAARVAELNGQIQAATVAGLDPHDLSDQRDLMVMELGKLAGVTTRTVDNGVVDVFIGGSALVRGNTSSALEVAETGPLAPPLDGSGFDRVQIQWAVDGSDAGLTEGTLGGMLAGTNVHLPQATVELNGVAASLVTSVNALHVTGQGLNPVADVGLNFFDPAGVTAMTLSLSTDVAGQPSRVALAAAGAGALDASIAQQMAALAGAANGADATYQQMVGRIGVATQTATRRVSIQDAVVRAADDARLSVSGVSLDEELTSLVQSQRAYEASARVLTTVDEMLNVLINRTGVVGR